MNEIQTAITNKGKIEYLLKGRGPAVLIVHGGHGSCRSDYRQDRLIDKGFSVLIPTRPGYGGTPIDSGTTAESTADLFAALLAKLNVKTARVIGNSAGGPTALELARKYPENVDKLILEAAVVKPWFHRLRCEYYGSKFIFHPKRQRKFWQNLSKKLQKNPEKTLIRNMKLFTRLNPGAVIAGMNKEEIELLKYAMITGNDSGEGFVHDVDHRAPDISKIQCPTLIIHSRNDGSVPFSHAEYAHKMIPGSILFEAPTDSHFIYFGRGSEEVLRKRTDFLIS